MRSAYPVNLDSKYFYNSLKVTLLIKIIFDLLVYLSMARNVLRISNILRS